MLSGIFIEVRYNFFSTLTEILFSDFYSEFLAFNRFFKGSYNIIKIFSLIAELNGFYDNFCNEVSTIIKEVIFSHGGMTGSFYCKGAVYAFFILTDSLIYDIFVASFKAEMFAFEVFFNEFFQTA